MSDPYGGSSGDRNVHEQETRAQAAVDPYAASQGPDLTKHEEQGQEYYASPPQYGQQPAYGQQYPSYGTPPAYGQGAQTYGQQYPQQAYNPYAGYQPAPSNGMAIASFVTSLAGTFVVCGVSGIVGIILGVIALKRSKELQGAGHGMAVAGIVIGVIQLLLVVGFVILMIVVAANDQSGSTYGTTT